MRRAAVSCDHEDLRRFANARVEGDLTAVWRPTRLPYTLRRSTSARYSFRRRCHTPRFPDCRHDRTQPRFSCRRANTVERTRPWCVEADSTVGASVCATGFDLYQSCPRTYVCGTFLRATQLFEGGEISRGDRRPSSVASSESSDNSTSPRFGRPRISRFQSRRPAAPRLAFSS